MSSRGALTVRYAVYGGSVAFHLALATAAVLTPKPKKAETVAISLAEAPKPKPKVEAPPPPPPPPPSPVASKAKAAPKAPAKAEAPLAEAPPPSDNAAPEGFADLGLTLGNGPGGIGLPVAAAAPAAPREAVKTVRALAPKHEDTCDEPPVKAKLRGAAVKPAYTSEARSAQVEGVVRVELTVGDDGRVTSVKVLRGLGYGLDEAAMAAAKQMEFEPGTRCGKSAVTKLTVGMRFNLE